MLLEEHAWISELLVQLLDAAVRMRLHCDCQTQCQCDAHHRDGVHVVVVCLLGSRCDWLESAAEASVRATARDVRRGLCACSGWLRLGPSVGGQCSAVSARRETQRAREGETAGTTTSTVVCTLAMVDSGRNSGSTATAQWRPRAARARWLTAHHAVGCRCSFAHRPLVPTPHARTPADTEPSAVWQRRAARTTVPFPPTIVGSQRAVDAGR